MNSLPQDKPANDTPPTRRGTRQTEQRKAVFEALMAQADHPNAVEVFMRVKAKMPTISLATVYNCLENLTESGLIRAVNHEREPSRFCANREEHAHLFCTECGSVTDIAPRAPAPADEVWNLPAGITITSQEVAFRGLCARCSCAETSSSLQP